MQVVDEDHDELFALLWPVVPFPPPHIHLILDGPLYLVRCRLTGEGRGQIRVNVVHILLVDLILDVDSLARPGAAAKEIMDLILDPEIDERVVSYRVIGRDEQFMVRRILIDPELWLCLIISVRKKILNYLRPSQPAIIPVIVRDVEQIFISQIGGDDLRQNGIIFEL